MIKWNTKTVSVRSVAVYLFNFINLLFAPLMLDIFPVQTAIPGLEVIKLEFILRLRIKCNDWLIADMCTQAANHCALF